MKPLSHAAIILLAAHVAALHSQTKPRARDLGVPFHGQPAPVNAITDVAGVEVGMTTLISGSGALKIGSGPVRTGVTAILPRARGSSDLVTPVRTGANPISKWLDRECTRLHSSHTLISYAVFCQTKRRYRN